MSDYLPTHHVKLLINGREALMSKDLEEPVYSHVAHEQNPWRMPMRELNWSDLDTLLAEYESGALGQCYAEMEARALWRLHYW